MGVKVVKFGGSSVADADQVRKIRATNTFPFSQYINVLVLFIVHIKSNSI